MQAEVELTRQIEHAKLNSNFIELGHVHVTTSLPIKLHEHLRKNSLICPCFKSHVLIWHAINSINQGDLNS